MSIANTNKTDKLAIGIINIDRVKNLNISIINTNKKADKLDIDIMDADKVNNLCIKIKKMTENNK